MDDDNLMDVNFTDLDLNQEPTDPPENSVVGVGSLLIDMESSRGRIAQRFRQLEAVNARAIQRGRWRIARNPTETTHFPTETMVNLTSDGAAIEGNSNTEVFERTAEKGKGCKRDSSHLVAKALEMDSELKRVDKEGGSFYDCNICLEIATDPVLTICGHLFCWACFYQVSYIDSTNKECPVCKGEVSDSTVIPIYGNGGGERVYVSESGLTIPPRPKARRVESIRQQRVTQGLSHVPVVEALRRIRISIGALGDQAADQEDHRAGTIRPDIESATDSQIVGEASGSRGRIHQVSRVLSESAASLSSLSSALSSAERLVVDLESAINNRFSRNDTGVDGGNPSDVLSNDQPPPDLTTDNHATSSTDVSGSVLHLLRTRTLRSSSVGSVPLGTTAPSTQRRRSNIVRILDLNHRDAREARRRRLN